MHVRVYANVEDSRTVVGPCGAGPGQTGWVGVGQGRAGRGVPGTFLRCSWAICSWNVPGTFLGRSWKVLASFLERAWNVPGAFLERSLRGPAAQGRAGWGVLGAFL